MADQHEDHIYLELNSVGNENVSTNVSPVNVGNYSVRREKPIWLLVLAIFISAVISSGLTYVVVFLTNTSDTFTLNTTDYSKNFTSSNTCTLGKNNDFRILHYDSQCPQDWYNYNAGCYLKVKELKTWLEAQDFCRSKGSNLLSFHSKVESTTIIQRYLSRREFYWIGLQDRDQDTRFTWNDGSALDYINWDIYEPNRLLGVEGCVLLSTTGRWHDANCYLPQFFVCKTVTTFRCGKGNWLYYNSSCYMFNTQGMTATWDEARNSCLEIGAHLAVIQTRNELDFLLSQTFQIDNRNYWIGLKKRMETDNYGWIDGTVGNFLPWNGEAGSGSCVFIEYFGTYKTNECEDRLGYVCEKVL